MGTTRDALIDAAAGLLAEGGVPAVTLREVGSRAGVSHNAPYKHFADKQDLLAAVAAQELRRAASWNEHVAGERTAGETVRVMLHASVARARENPELFRLTYGPWSRGSDELAEAADAARSSFVAAVARAQADGDMPPGDPDRLTGLLLAVTRGALELALAGHLERGGKGNADPDDLVDDLLALLGRNGRT